MTVTLALVLSCGPREAARVSAPAQPERPPETHRYASLPSGGVIGEYAVTYDGQQDLRVEATLAVTAPSLEVEDGADAFLSDVEGAPLEGGTWKKATRDRHTFVLTACAAGPCRLRYKSAMRAAAKGIGELEVASEEGAVIVAPPSSWLLTPPREDKEAKVRFRVKTPEGTAFATGVYRSPTAEGAWEITLSDLWTAPYSAFGPLRIRKMGNFDIAFGPGKLGLSDDQIAEWGARAEKAVSGYFGTFPMKNWLLIVIAGTGRSVGEGKTLSGGGGAIFMRVGERATTNELTADWVLTHEMTHLTFPTLPRTHHWAEEGCATYVEPFARARTGWISVEEAWKGVVEGVPQGQPEPGDQGLDRTHTWGRTYWGGALFFLAADVGIRKRTSNRYGLEHALRGINAAGGNNSVRWSIADTFAAGDKAVGVPVLSELYAKMGNAPTPVDLTAMWKDLGIVYANGKITFDDKAPSAAVRKAITTPN